MLSFENLPPDTGSLFLQTAVEDSKSQMCHHTYIVLSISGSESEAESSIQMSSGY